MNTEPIVIVHVIGPLGEPICPSCGSHEVESRGSWDYGPFWWQCEDCDEQWGAA